MTRSRLLIFLPLLLASCSSRAGVFPVVDAERSAVAGGNAISAGGDAYTFSFGEAWPLAILAYPVWRLMASSRRKKKLKKAIQEQMTEPPYDGLAASILDVQQKQADLHAKFEHLEGYLVGLSGDGGRNGQGN